MRHGSNARHFETKGHRFSHGYEDYEDEEDFDDFDDEFNEVVPKKKSSRKHKRDKAVADELMHEAPLADMGGAEHEIEPHVYDGGHEEETLAPVDEPKSKHRHRHHHHRNKEANGFDESPYDRHRAYQDSYLML